MKIFTTLALVLSVTTTTVASARQPVSETRTGGWVGSAGIGLWIDPSLFLLSPQLEYVYRQNFYFGPLVQLGLGSGTLFTATGTGRFIFSHTSRVRPSIEAGLGLAFATGASVGIHIPFGVGVDYQLDGRISLGTLIRANLIVGSGFGNNFSVSWPLLIGRFAI